MCRGLKVEFQASVCLGPGPDGSCVLSWFCPVQCLPRRLGIDATGVWSQPKGTLGREAGSDLKWFPDVFHGGDWVVSSAVIKFLK